MVLKVLGRPYISDKGHSTRNVLHVYNTTDRTLIDLDCDIVTLGIAVNVLNKEFEDFLQSLDEQTAERIRRVTKEVANNG